MTCLTSRIRCLLFIGILVFSTSRYVSAHAQSAEKLVEKELLGMSVSELEEAVQQCGVVMEYNRVKAASTPPTFSVISKIFSILFPGSPAINAMLGTLYISGPPNLLLALCPPNIDPSSLAVMVAFAVGGILGDTLFHLLPEIFLGEAESDHVRFVLVSPNKNLLLGLAIMVGFLTFVAMDKGLRIATGGDNSHGHSHSQSDEPKNDTVSSVTVSGADVKSTVGELKERKPAAKSSNPITSVSDPKEPSQSVRLSAYLNLIADFTHNITDGLAMSSSFYASPILGATTTVAVFFHEIPHEVGDFALLVQSGFSKKRAMGAQFVTALGAFLGTCLGIAVQEMGKTSGLTDGARETGFAGTGLGWGDLLLPFTAGTFLYVGTVAVIPELLETGSNKVEESKSMLKQFAAMALGAGIMLSISWS